MTKGNNSKLQNEVLAQIVTDNSAKWLRLGRLFPKIKLKNDSEYYTFFKQAKTLQDAIASGDLGEAKPIAPGVSLQELNVRTPVNETVAINTIGGVLNISKQVMENNILSVSDMVKDIGALIGDTIERELYSVIAGAGFATKNITSGEDITEFVIDAQEAYKEAAGDFNEMNVLVTNYKDMTDVKKEFLAVNKGVEPVEDIKAYFGLDNIDVMGTAICDGGKEFTAQSYLAFDINNPPISLLYSQTSGATVAPLGPNGEIVDFYPLVELLRKDIWDELPQYSKIFVETRVGFKLNSENLAIKGSLDNS